MIITFAWIEGNAMNDPIKLADKSLSNQQYSSAIYYYSLAIEANEVNAALYFKRARVYLFMNKYEEYLQDIETAISLDPKLPLKLDESTLKELKVF
jgi:tetratricopeptide (TPR) repeat protein